MCFRYSAVKSAPLLYLPPSPPPAVDLFWRQFVTSGNVYESYTMSGAMGGDPGSNYLEHCGGYSWAVAEGLFGVDFNSDSDAAATINDPSKKIDPSWPVNTQQHFTGILQCMGCPCPCYLC